MLFFNCLKRDFLYGVWLKKMGHGFDFFWRGGLENKKYILPFRPPNFLSTIFLSFLTLFLYVPIPLNLPSPDPFVIPTTTLCTMYCDVYMRERNRFELHLPRLEPGTSDIS